MGKPYSMRLSQWLVVVTDTVALLRILLRRRCGIRHDRSHRRWPFRGAADEHFPIERGEPATNAFQPAGCFAAQRILWDTASAVILYFQHNERFTLRDTHGNILGVRVFDGVCHQLRRREIQSGLQRFGQTPSQRARECSRYRGAGAQRAHCLIQSAVRQQRRANTPHQSA